MIAMNNEKGDRFLQALAPLLAQNGICTAFTERIPTQSHIFDSSDILFNWSAMLTRLTDPNVNIWIVNAETQDMLGLQWLLFLAEVIGMKPLHKVWVMTAQWDFSLAKSHGALDVAIFQGSLSLAIHSSEVPGFQNYLQMLSPFSERDGFIKDFWEQAFNCFFPDTDVNKEENCTMEEKLQSLPGPFFEMGMTGRSYSIYNAVYAIAHALHIMYSSQTKRRALAHADNLKLHRLSNLQVMSLAGDTVNPFRK